MHASYIGRKKSRLPQPKAVVIAVASMLQFMSLSAQAQTELPQVTVTGDAERADGPVKGYNATRSATFTKTDTSLKEVPASVTVVPSDLMKDQAMQSMSDVFRYVPGAITAQGENNRDEVVLRGNKTNADFYIDGVRDDAQIFRDLYNLERVEVLKGPGGMAFGRGGAGGVVNRVSKMPVFSRVGEASLTLGSYGQVRGTVDIGNKLNDTLAWRLNAVAENANGFREGTKLRRYALNPTLTYTPTGRTQYSIGYEHLIDERTPDRGNPTVAATGLPFVVNRNTFFGNASQSYAFSKVNSLYAIVNHEFDNGTTLKNTFRVTHYDKFYQNIFSGSQVNAANTMTISAYNNLNTRTNVFNQTDLITKFNIGGMEHKMLYGVEVGYQASSNRRLEGLFGASVTNLTGVSAFNPIATVTSFAPAATGAQNLVKADVFAGYIQDQISLSKEWKLLAGLRYDSFKTDVADQRTVVTAALPTTNLSRTDTAFSPRLGLTWSPTESQSYYANYSYSFLPSGEVLGLAATTASLAPEKSKNYEIGAKWDVMPALALTAAAFRLDKTDVRVADPGNPGFFIKTGKQRVTGFELGLQGDVTKSWQIFAGYTHLNGRILQPVNTGTGATVATTIPAGRKLPLVPQSAFSIWNKVSFENGFGLGLGVIRQGESFATISNTALLPAFTRVDAAAYYAFDRKTRLSLNIENIGNKTYFPTADNDQNISVGAPRTVRLTLNSTF